MWLGTGPRHGGGLGWGNQGLTYFEIKPPMPSVLLISPGQSAWKHGIGVFLKGEGIEIKQDAYNSSAF